MDGRFIFESEDNRYVPDTSVVINGGLKKLLVDDRIEPGSTITIPIALLAELENQANLGERVGLIGLEQLKSIRATCEQKQISFTMGGRKPRQFELGEIDALIRELAWKEGGTLITSDNIQNLSAQSMGVKTLFIESRTLIQYDKRLKIDQYFDNETMSIHIKQGTNVFVKKGIPGTVKFIQFSSEIITKEVIINYADEILEKAAYFPDTFIEIDRKTSTIVQYEDRRIVITRPPFSDGWEITAVRPLKRMSLEEYGLSSRLNQRLEEKAEGILVAGSPGAGKTTFTRALALFYSDKGKIIKTIESPRDLDLKVEITQYSKNFGTHSEIHDILLLSRPDYTIFDEIRDRDDFRLYTDLRLSGIGLIGVIHSSTAIDAIQRFIGKLELGIIPSVLDTIIYIDSGQIQTILDVKMTVKVPSGLVESDLARPVIEVRDFLTGSVVYEMYTFGEQTVVIPLQNTDYTTKEVKPERLSEIKSIVEQYTSQSVEIVPKDRYGHRFEIHAHKEDIPIVIGQKGVTIKKLERILNVKLDVNKSHNLHSTGLGRLTRQNIAFHKRTITISFPKRIKNREIRFFFQESDDSSPVEFFTATTSKSGKIKLATNSEIGEIFQKAFKDENLSLHWK
ncbi:ATPase [Candidatus Heimdallarchaeota archaeon B3_Heim]|nr:MAG: ATPase [Candidatus Heimdallarchaeota archaeon B3_Heim]